jgi:rhodanese-related sulfurtransferase
MEPSRISCADAKSEIDSGEPILFLDVRNPQAWSGSDRKLPGAIHLGVDEVEQHSHKLPRDRLIISYCT